MKKLNFTEIANSIKPEAWDFFQNDPILKKIESNEEKVGAFVVAIIGQYSPKTVAAMRNLGKAIDKIEENKKDPELSDEEFNLVKQAWDELAGGFQARARHVILPICDYLDTVSK